MRRAGWASLGRPSPSCCAPGLRGGWEARTRSLPLHLSLSPVRLLVDGRPWPCSGHSSVSVAFPKAQGPSWGSPEHRPRAWGAGVGQGLACQQLSSALRVPTQGPWQAEVAAATLASAQPRCGADCLETSSYRGGAPGPDGHVPLGTRERSQGCRSPRKSPVPKARLPLLAGPPRVPGCVVPCVLSLRQCVGAQSPTEGGPGESQASSLALTLPCRPQDGGLSWPATWPPVSPRWRPQQGRLCCSGTWQ